MAPYLYGLTPEWQQRAVNDEVLNLVALQPADVTSEIPGNDPDIDWEHLIFIKNCRTTGRRAKTIVWTQHNGFVKTAIGPDRLVDNLVRAGLVTWLDMAVELAAIHGHRPLPYVWGELQLIPSGQRHGNHRSWLNGYYCEHVNAVATRQNRTHILLSFPCEIEIADSAGRLRAKLTEAHRIKNLQAEHCQQIRQQYLRPGHPLEVIDPKQRFDTFAKRRDLAFAQQLLKYLTDVHITDEPLSAETLSRLVESIQCQDLRGGRLVTDETRRFI